MLCFKNYSSKERSKKKAEALEAIRLEQEALDEEEDDYPRRSRRHPHSPGGTARMPRDQRRRRSSVKLRDTHDFRGRVFRDEDLENIRDRRASHPSHTRPRNR